jgi:predicted CXXCH cytochrome family protein
LGSWYEYCTKSSAEEMVFIFSEYSRAAWSADMSEYNKKMVGFFILIIFAVAAGLSVRDADAGISRSKHDFSTNAGTPYGGIYKMSGSPVNEVCIFCHTPHGASTSQFYKDGAGGTILWNRITPDGAGPNNDKYTLYTSSSLTMINVTAPTGTSLMCLSCHDGVTGIAVDAASATSPQTLLERGSGNPTISLTMSGANVDYNNKIGAMYYPGSFLGSGANIGGLSPYGATTGVDLSNDHPVSFNWVDGIPGIQSPTDARLRLFGTNRKMECATCHNVHDNTTYPPFLVMSNSGSAMCFACHNI